MAIVKCEECGKEVSDQAVMCPHCGFQSETAKKNMSARGGIGIDYASVTKIGGVPLVRVATGITAKGAPRVAVGIIAVGNIAVGGVAFGGVAVGGLSFGGVSIGLAALGGCALGILFGAGGLATGFVALGGMAIGYYAIGGGAVGAHTIHNDPQLKQWLFSIFKMKS